MQSSMAANIIGSILLLVVVFGLASITAGFASFTEAFKKEASTTTFHMADTAAMLVDGDYLEDYLAGERADEYSMTRRYLNKCCQKLGVSLIYVIVVDTSDYGRFKSVFNAVDNTVDDSHYVEWELGHEQDTTNEKYREKYKAIYEDGSPCETIYRVRDLGGMNPHITTMVPVKDDSGTVRGILCVQRPMSEFYKARKPYVITTAIAAAIIALISSVIAVIYIRLQFVKPIRKVAAEAIRFAHENTITEPLGSLSSFKELSGLSQSIDTMEHDMVSYIDNLTAVTSEKQRIDTELALATRIQMNSVPNTFPAFPERNDFDIYASMSPAREVGGDFYNYVLIDDDHLAIVIGDVSGKGIPAALYMMVTNIMATERSRIGADPADILTGMNRTLCSRNTLDMFVTVWLGIIELSTGLVRAANAGHEYPAVMDADGSFELLMDKHGLVVGAMEEASYKGYEFTLKPGSRLFIYTDGVPEATDPDGGMFGNERMVASLNRHKDSSLKDLLENVRKDVDEFVRGAEQFDDLTMLCLEYNG